MTTEGAKPLNEFQRIGHNTYLFTPEAYGQDQPLVLLFSWMGAASKHIAKYTVAYRKLYPGARILLIRNELQDFFRFRATYDKFLERAADVVKVHVKSGGELLVHSFSNGGANQLCEFARLWVQREGSPLPMRAQVVDSAPGNGPWMRSHKAMATALPRFWLFRTLGSVAIHLFLASLFVYGTLTGRGHKVVYIRQKLNQTLFFEHAPRVYLYSKGDEMVGDDEVEEHADQAEAEGWQVTRVRFERSPHAGHIREDEGRYWAAVQKAWNDGARTV